MGRTSVVIVHFGDPAPTYRAVCSVRRNAADSDVFVVDNGGLTEPQSDSTVSVLRSGRNLGYGAACNLGARSSSSEFLLLMNNDIEIDAGTLQALEAALDRDPMAAAAGPRLFDSGGRAVRSIGRAPTPRRVLFENLFLPRLVPGVPFFHGHHTTRISHRRRREVETLLGAIFLVRRSAFKSVRGFDEEYFFYLEESDLFARLRAAGWKILFEPAASAVHQGSVASSQLAREDLDAWLHDGFRRYARTHHGQRGERLTVRALIWGARLRWLLAHLRPGTEGLPRRRRYAMILARYRAAAARNQTPTAKLPHC
jgi:N-acetylglucosaminyl-diphospho-decaprenol L-rhamnosyltransferase